MWYTREEALRRFAIFFNSVTMAGAFGGLLASAIENMDGISGYSGWRWIFILEGLLTIAVGALSYLLISDFPETAGWLSEDERAMIYSRLAVTQEHENDNAHTWKGIVGYFKDYKSHLAALIYFGQ